MKRMIMCAWLMVSLAGVAIAQKTEKINLHKQQAEAATLKKGEAVNIVDTINLVSLISTGSYEAFAENQAENQLVISDPVVLNLHISAVTDSRTSSSILKAAGITRSVYGIANGNLVLLPQGARTSGSITGSGSVGTGTSIGIVGSFGPASGLNGKNPFAGHGIYGITGAGAATQLLPYNTAQRMNGVYQLESRPLK